MFDEERLQIEAGSTRRAKVDDNDGVNVYRHVNLDAAVEAEVS